MQEFQFYTCFLSKTNCSICIRSYEKNHIKSKFFFGIFPYMTKKKGVGERERDEERWIKRRQEKEENGKEHILLTLTVVQKFKTDRCSTSDTYTGSLQPFPTTFSM